MAWSLKKALGWDSSPYVKKEDELFKGVPKPTEVLVGMIIATIQKDLKRTKGSSFPASPYKDTFGRTWEWSNDFLEVRWQWKDVSCGYNSLARYTVADLTVSLKGKTLPLSDNEYARLANVAKEAMKWKKEYDNNKVEMDRQQEAVNLIEEFFKPKEKKVTEEDNSPKEARAEPEDEEPNQLSQMIS